MKCILFVGDDESMLDGLRRMLEGQRGRWELYFASSGKLALDACACLHFDVVLTDLRMAGMDGIALLHAMRERHPETARLLLADQEDSSLATRAASVAYRILFKPLNQEDLISAIVRVCILQESFTTPAMRKIIGRVGALPSLSSTYTALSLAVRDPDATIRSFAAIIERDIAMAAKVLQIVNSGFFSLARTMTTVAAAVSYLGMDTILNLTLAAETFGIFVPDPTIPVDFLETMHRRAERTASIVGTLPLSVRDREVAIMAALLHDIGELALACRMPLHVRGAFHKAKELGCTLYEAEEKIAGVSHAELGAYLLGVWGIGGQIVEAVAYHHRPQRIEQSGLNSISAVYLAALIADELEVHPDDRNGAELNAADKDSLQALGLIEHYPRLRARAVQALQIRQTVMAGGT